jgi:Flp pilus assembly protein TadB
LLNGAVSLANALTHANALEAKLKATTKALEEADNKHAKEVAATKLASYQADKEAEARDNKAKRALAEVSQRQTKREEAVVKRIDHLMTSFGSKCCLAVVFVFSVSMYILIIYVSMMQQSNLEKSSGFVQAQPMTFFWIPLAYLNLTGRTLGM